MSAGSAVGLQTFWAVLMLTVVLVLGVEGRRVCQTKDFLLIQSTCRDQNKDLLSAEKTHDDHTVCKNLFQLWYCVAGNVPVCFHNLTEIYKVYMHSPHNCAPSPSQIRRLQTLTRQAARREGQGDVDVDIVTLPHASTHPPPPHNATGVDDGGGGGGSGTTPDNQKGGSHKHTGDGNGASIPRQMGVPLIAVSWLVALRMTSYLLHS